MNNKAVDMISAIFSVGVGEQMTCPPYRVAGRAPPASQGHRNRNRQRAHRRQSSDRNKPVAEGSAKSQVKSQESRIKSQESRVKGQVKSPLH